MLALGADQVILRDGVVLNPHYRTMGLYGSEYWTYVLPRRVGDDRGGEAHRTVPADRRRSRPHGSGSSTRCSPDHRPSSSTPCWSTPPGSPDATTTRDCSSASSAAREADERRKPLEAYRVEELAEMSRDIFDDRNGFAAARHAFVTKQKPTSTPRRIASHRAAITQSVDTDVDAVERAS